MIDKKQLTELLTRDARSGKLGRCDFIGFAVAAGMSVAASWENDGARAAHRWWFA